MSENLYVKICLNLISLKMGWGDSESWTHFHFTKLSDQVSNLTGISVSSDTLKRLTGKKRTPTEYTPRAETKQALAQFIGYSGWENFTINYKANESVEIPANTSTQPLHKTKKLSSKLIISAVLVIFIIIIGIAILWFNRESIVKGRLSVDNRTGDSPITTMVHYSVSGVLFGNVYLDWGYEKNYITFIDKHPFKLEKNQGFINQCYFIPGWYAIRLKYENKVLDSMHVHITTANKWRPYVILPEKNDLMLDLQPEGSENEFIFDRKDIEDHGFKEADSYWTELRMIKETNLKANNFEWIADIKNSPENGAIVCNDVVAELQLESSMIRIHFVQPGCTQFSEIKLLNKALKGNSDNLSFLGINFFDYKRLKIKSKDSQISFSIDDAVLYTDTIKSKESIKGLVFKFKGCGSAKNISFASILD